MHDVTAVGPRLEVAAGERGIHVVELHADHPSVRIADREVGHGESDVGAEIQDELRFADVRGRQVIPARERPPQGVDVGGARADGHRPPGERTESNIDS
jgi:hypothetical protein